MGDGWLLAALGFASFLSLLSALALGPFLPAIAAELGTPVALLGQIPAVALLAAAALGVLIGPLADRYGHRRALLAGALALLAGAAGTALARGFAPLLLAVLLGTASRAVLSPVAQAVAGTRFAGEARRRAISRLTSAVTVAPILGVPLLTAVATAAGWRAAFGALALLAAVAIGLLTLAVPRDAAGERRPLRLQTVRAAYRPLLGHPPTLGIIGASLLRSMAIWGMFTYFGAFLVERHGLSSQEVGWAYMLTGLGGLAGSWAAGGRLGRAPLRPLLMGAGVALALLLAAVLILPVGAAAAAGLAAAATAGIAFSGVVGATLLTAESPAGRATTLTVNQTAFSLGTAAGSSLGGALLAVGGYAALGLGLPLCGFASALLLWLTRPGRRPAGAPAPAPAPAAPAPAP